MYPLNMHSGAVGGYAVANTEAEHQSLTAAGYGPALVVVAVRTLESVRAELDAAGIEYDGRMGLVKLQSLLP